MSVTQRAANMTAIHTDRWGGLLAALFLVVIAGAVWVATTLTSLGAEPAMAGSSGAEQAAAGAGWALLEVVIAVGLLGIILVYNRLPEWAQNVVKTAVFVTLAMWTGVLADRVGVFVPAAAGLVGFYAIIKAADAYDVYWLWNNVESIAVAVIGAGLLGAVLPLPFLAIGIVGLTIYDHVFANQKDWMFTLGGGMLRAKLPVIVFAFPRLRVNWDDICDALDGGDVDEETKSVVTDHRGFGIGMADLLLPAAFAAAVSVAGGGVTFPVIGVVGGVVLAAFRLRWEMVNLGGGAGLPAITTGMLAGYGVAMVPVVILA